MASNGLFTINEFSKLSRLTRNTLIHYDDLGLLTPASRGANSYRYYSSGQLAVANVIRTLQSLGMPLDEIRALKDKMNPAMVSAIFEQQNEKIELKKEGWVRAQKLLFTFINIIHSVVNVDEDKITIQYVPAEPIIFGDLNDYSHGRNDYDALLSFYHSIPNMYPDLDLNYPVWGVFSENRIKRGDWVWPDRYYFYNPEGHDKRPAALYAIGYTRGGYGECDELYGSLVDYIEQSGFEISGDAYEEYPLNEVCITENNNYLIRVMITVKKKDSSDPADAVDGCLADLSVSG